MTRNIRPISDLLWTLAGPIAWSAHLFLVYAIATVICTRTAASSSVMPWLLIATTAIALAALLFVMIRRRNAPDTPSFLRQVSFILALISTAAIAGTAISGLGLATCE
jgi:cytochrome bd-type quinol oxidase subunit 2